MSVDKFVDKHCNYCLCQCYFKDVKIDISNNVNATCVV